MTKVLDIVNYLKTKYPLELASTFDHGKVGLQFGSMNKEVKKVLIALDGTSKVVNEAVENNVELLITHHPFMFNSMLSLNYDSPMGQKMLKVFKNDLNIYAMHTNYDSAIGGMNDMLGEMLGFDNTNALFDENVSDNFLRYGNIKEMTLGEYVEEVKKVFGLKSVRVVGNLNKKIKTVGIVGGSGTSELFKAIHSGCDCFVTGEIKQNHAIDASEYGLCLIEVPHAVEGFYKEIIKRELTNEFPEVEFIVSIEDKDPFTII